MIIIKAPNGLGFLSFYKKIDSDPRYIITEVNNNSTRVKLVITVINTR